VNEQADLPQGFLGPVASLTALRPEGATGLSRLRLPAASQQSGSPDDALHTEGHSFDGIEVWAFTESMGPIERALAGWSRQLDDGGRLVVDVENAQSMRQLRTVLEGRPGQFDPFGDPCDPSQAVTLRRLIDAAAATGLHIVDVVRVPWADAVPRRLLQGALDNQLLPLDWIEGAPAARFWLVADKRSTMAGSVLIGPGAPGDQAATEARVRACLPPEWEVIRCQGDHEPEAFSRGVSQATGDLVWFLRAGAKVSADLFDGLALAALSGPAVPGGQAASIHAGDITGLMVSRDVVLQVGPLSRGYLNSKICYESWTMRLESCVQRAVMVAGEFASPSVPIERPECFADEAQQLMDLWGRHLEGSATEVDPVAADGVENDIAPAPAPWRGRTPRISLCMITRNEERFLDECLTRAKAAVDEIVIVDTGSTDRTVAIAERHGAKVLHEAWQDDFSAPRNTAMQAASGDWILVLDADEFLADGAADQLRELVRREDVSGYHMRFTNVYSGGKSMGVLMVRLLRNLEGVHYENCIHEQMTPSLVRIGRQRGLELSLCDVEVEHYGYTDEVMDQRGKNERNERLFHKQLQQDPDDIYSLYKYGDFLRRLPGRSVDARTTLEHCFRQICEASPKVVRGLPYAGEVAALCALENVRVGRIDQAREFVDVGLRRFIPSPNLHYIAASLMVMAGENDAAITHFRRCLAYRDQVLVVPIQDGITGHVALTGIAQALMQKGLFDRGRRLLERALAEAPDYEAGHVLLSQLQMACNQVGEALQTLTGFLSRQPDSAACCQQATVILHGIGKTEHARRFGERAVDLLRKSGAEREAAQMQETLAAL
jgi:glycosyltransferase involved in cell wall biosynthesis